MISLRVAVFGGLNWVALSLMSHLIIKSDTREMQMKI